MKLIAVLIVTALIIIFTDNAPEVHYAQLPAKPQTAIVQAEPMKERWEEPQPEETYIDSLKIGVPGKNRLDLFKTFTEDSVYVDITFYEKKGKQWSVKNRYHFLKDGISGCNPESKDFNNDGLNDFTYQSAIAARGANEIRNLFIFDRKSGSLRYMKNSEEYPNLQYNQKLNCIDAFRVFGGTTSDFLIAEKDSLRMFATVELYGEGIREAWRIDRKGKRTLISRDSMEGVYIRYENFDPVTEYAYDSY